MFAQIKAFWKGLTWKPAVTNLVRTCTDQVNRLVVKIKFLIKDSVVVQKVMAAIKRYIVVVTDRIGDVVYIGFMALLCAIAILLTVAQLYILGTCIYTILCWLFV